MKAKIINVRGKTAKSCLLYIDREEEADFLVFKAWHVDEEGLELIQILKLELVDSSHDLAEAIIESFTEKQALSLVNDFRG